MIGSLIKRLRGNQGNAFLSFDLLYQLSYMSVIAGSGVPRHQIFERAAQAPCASAEYFQRIELTCRKLGYDYAKACRLVGESAKDEEVKELLLRFSSSLFSGETETDFLVREAQAQAEAYENEYGRQLETLRLWTDAYVSLMLSAVIVVIMGVVSTMIWKIEMVFLVGLSVIAVSTAALGVWLIYLMAPKEMVALSWAGSDEQKTVRKLFKLLLPLALVAGAVTQMLTGNLGLALLAIAALIFPIGLISLRDEKKVTKRDVEVGAFLRSLGGVAGAIGTTVREALGRLDMEAINILRRQVTRIYTRLNSVIATKVCWHRFIDETGSELANRSVGMFYDAIDIGGEAEKAGYYASLYTSKITMLRARRRTVSSPFHWLCIAMHGAVAALLVFVTEIITTFGGMVAQAKETLPTVSGASSGGTFSSFNFAGLEMVNAMVIPVILIFTFANALAPSIAGGGSGYKFLFTIGITAAISGASLAFLPTIAGMIFTINI
jgi:flagellar protein FlaJ